MYIYVPTHSTGTNLIHDILKVVKLHGYCMLKILLITRLAMTVFIIVCLNQDFNKCMHTNLHNQFNMYVHNIECMHVYMFIKAVNLSTGQ